MSAFELPHRASIEYLKKLAKERLRDLRRTDPGARLSDAQHAVARDHGFPSWRALRTEVTRLRSPTLAAFFAACAAGDVEVLRDYLLRDPGLVRERNPAGSMPLHLAAAHPEALRLLLAHGADPNTRDAGDNALPLHFAAGRGPVESVITLLDAGSDVHGFGDVHRLEVIGWATVFAEARREVVPPLVERGARHHVFSAVALGDLDLLQLVVEDDPDAIARRLSRFEQEQTALHYVIAPPDGLTGGFFRTGEHYRTLEMLIELGADLEAEDARGRTPLAVARLHGDREATRRLLAAGAREPGLAAAPRARSVPELGASVGKLTPMLGVTDMKTTLAWYRSIGFALEATHEEDGSIDWASITLGQAKVMLAPVMEPRREATSLSLWVHTDRLDDIYALLKRRQLETGEVRFTVDLHTAFYGQREFGIRDPDGVNWYFYQPLQ